MRYRTRLASRQSKKYLERKKTRSLVLALLVIISLLSWTYAFSRLTYLNFLTIDNFDVVGADRGMSANIEAVARQSLQGQILGLFSRANSFLYPAKSLTAGILDSSPKIQSVSIYRNNLQTLAIVVQEKQAAAIVCPGLPDFSANGILKDSLDNCFEADPTGYIFNMASSTSPGRNLYYIQSLADASSTTVVGSQAASTSDFTQLQYFYNGTRQAGLSIQAILVKDGGEYEMYVLNNQTATSTSDSGTTVVYFNDSRSLVDQLANLISFWNSAKGPFEYIDVRYGSNVFYRRMP